MGFSASAKVGAVVVVAIILLGIITVEMGVWKNKQDEGTPYYVIFDNVNGLQIGAPVLKAGVNVGKVGNITIIGESEPKELIDKVRVTMLIRDKKEPLTVSSYYSISTNLMGDKWLEIHPKSGKHMSPAKDSRKPWKDDYAMGTPPITMDELMQSARTAVSELQTTIANLNNIVGDPAVQTELKTAVKSMSEVASNLNSLSAKADKSVDMVVGRLVSVLDDAGSVMKNVDSMVASASGDVKVLTSTLKRIAEKNEGSINDIVANVDATSRSLKLAMQSVQELVSNEKFSYGILDTLENISKLTAELNGIASDVRSITSDPQVKENLKDTIKETKETMEGANKLIKRVRGVLGDSDGGKNSQSSRLVQFDADMLWDTKGGHSIGSANMYLLPRGEQMLKMGVEDIGTNNLVNFQYGRNYGALRPRVGVVRSQVGLGTDAFLGKNFELSVDAYNTSDVKVDLLGKYVINNGFYFMGGVRDTFDSKQCVVGVGKRF